MSVSLSAQSSQDVIYLKNGTIIKGTIIEQIVGQSVKIKSSSGAITSYPVSDIDKFEKENVKPIKNSFVTQYDRGMEKYHIAINLTGGSGLSWLSGFNDATGLDGLVKSTVMFGLGAVFPIDNTWAYETGLYYHSSGNAYKYSSDGVTTDGHIDLQYLEVPFLIRYDLLHMQNIKNATSVGLKSGFQLGFNTSAYDNGTNTWGSYSGGYSTSIDTRTNLDWVIGIYSCFTHSEIGLNFNCGLSNVMKNDIYSKNFKNKSVLVLYSYKF
jgi:hypothetical protein